MPGLAEWPPRRARGGRSTGSRTVCDGGVVRGRVSAGRGAAGALALISMRERAVGRTPPSTNSTHRQHPPLRPPAGHQLAKCGLRLVCSRTDSVGQASQGATGVAQGIFERVWHFCSVFREGKSQESQGALSFFASSLSPGRTGSLCLRNHAPRTPWTTPSLVMPSPTA